MYLQKFILSPTKEEKLYKGWDKVYLLIDLIQNK